MGKQYNHSREPDSCDKCRWFCASKGCKGACMLDKKEKERCRFFCTLADWEIAVKKRGVGGGGRNTQAKQDHAGKVTELQVMRLGYAGYCVTKAAHTLDRMPDGSLPPEFTDVLKGCISALEELSGWSYELQGKVASSIRTMPT